MTVEMWDGQSANSSDAGMLVKSVRGGGLAPPYEADPFADGTESEYVPPDKTVLSSGLIDPAILQLKTTSGPPIYTRAFFRAFDTSGTEVTDWTFESGVDDPHTIDVYERLTDLYRIIRGP